MSKWQKAKISEIDNALAKLYILNENPLFTRSLTGDLWNMIHYYKQLRVDIANTIGRKTHEIRQE